MTNADVEQIIALWLKITEVYGCLLLQHYSAYPAYYKPKLYPQGRTQKNHLKTSHHSLLFMNLSMAQSKR